MRSVGLRVVGNSPEELRRSLQNAMAEARKVLRDLDRALNNLDGEMSRVRRNNTLVIPSSSGDVVVGLTVYHQVSTPTVPDGPGLWHKPGNPTVTYLAESKTSGTRYWNQVSKGRVA